MWGRLLVLTGVLALCACTYKVRLLSDPPGASILLPDGSEAVTPHVASFRHGKRQLVRVELPGYRPLVVDMQRTEGPVLRYTGAAMFQKGGREVTFMLTEDRPPVGGREEAP